MPTAPLMQLPKTKSEEEFESICTNILTNYYGKSFSRYGRRGQKQHGIDIYCDTSNGKRIVAQCKNYLSLNSSDLINQIKSDIESANAKFKIETFVIMTALDRDTSVQDYVSGLKGEYSFPIELFFWEDIQLKIAEDDRLLNQYYGGLIPNIKPEKDMLITLLTESQGKCLNCGNTLGIPIRGKSPSARCEVVHITFSNEEAKGYEDAVALCPYCAEEFPIMSVNEKQTLLENKRRCADVQAFLERISGIRFKKEIETVLRKIHDVKNDPKLPKTKLKDLKEIKEKIHEPYLWEKIDASMARMYKSVVTICGRLEQENVIDTRVFGDMMKAAQGILSAEVAQKSGVTDPQEYVMRLLVDNLCAQVGQNHLDACEIIVGYLVKRCDLFNENAKQS